MHRTSAVSYEKAQPDRLRFNSASARCVPREQGGSRARRSPVVACGPRTGSYGQRNHSDRDANDGNQISDERCSPRFQRLFQDCCGTPTQRHGTEHFNDTSRNNHRLVQRPNCNARVLQRAEHEEGCVAEHQGCKQRFYGPKRYACIRVFVPACCRYRSPLQ